MRRFHAPPDKIDGRDATLDEDETRHLRDVLRLHAGDAVNLFDGEGREYLCQIAEIAKRSTVLNIVREVAAASPESPLELTLAAAVLKGEKYDLVIQKAVELGVATFVPLLTKRCDVKIKDGKKKLERWKKIGIEAAKQSGRARLMNIEPLEHLEAFFSRTRGRNSVLFSEREGKDLSDVEAGKELIAVIGPEGGWDDAELALARESGVRIVTLGGRILRAETAVISITAVLQHRFGDLN